MRVGFPVVDMFRVANLGGLLSLGSRVLVLEFVCCMFVLIVSCVLAGCVGARAACSAGS